MELNSMTPFGIAYLLVSLTVIFGGVMLAGYLHGRHMDRQFQKDLQSVTDPNRY